IQKFLSSENKGMVDAAQFLVLLHRDFFSYLAKKYSFIQFQQIFDINIRFEYYGFGLSAIDYYLSRFNETLVQNILEKYDTLSIEQKNTIIDFQSSPRFVKALDNYINEHKYTFKNISDNSLLELLSFHGIVQYYMLPALLIISRKIPNKATHAVIELITNPNDWWIGGSIGQTTRRYFRTMLGKDLKDIPIKLANHYKKQVVGALLAEMAQNHFDKNIGLQEKYVPTLHKLSKDSEALRYAEGWINHKSKTFSIFDKDKEYWAKVKAHLHDLSRK
ncbi:MAG: hypothetical protein LUQ20_07965, partial [Candidatus Methanoperedens sp.]|nr:hypothetical protein [Candidatus Methanoperedens sp.]